MEIETNGYYTLNTNGVPFIPINVNISGVGQIEPEKEVIITQNGVSNIVPDEGYDGIANVKVNTNVASEAENEKTLDVVANGTYSVVPTSPYTSLKLVNINVNVPTKVVDVPKYITLTKNAVYNILPKDGFDGFSEFHATVQVPTSINKTLTSVAGVDIDANSVTTATLDKVAVPITKGLLYNYKDNHQMFVLVVNNGTKATTVSNVYKYVLFDMYEEDDNGHQVVVDDGQLRLMCDFNGNDAPLFITLFEFIDRVCVFYFNMVVLGVECKEFE